MKRILSLAICFVTLFCSAVTSTVEANPAAGEIIPGESLGELKLGMSHEEICEILGDPLSLQKHQNGYSDVAVWSHSKGSDPNEDTTLIIYSNSKAVHIEVVSPEFKTAEGISTNSPLAKVFAQYKTPKLSAYEITTSENEFLYYLYDYSDKGITFGVWPDDYYDHSHKVDVIGVHKPGSKLITPIFGKSISPVLNQPLKRSSSSSEALPKEILKQFSKNGMPLTEHLSPDGARGFTSNPVLIKKGVGLFGAFASTYQGKKIKSSNCMLVFLSISTAADWYGETKTTLSFGSRRLLLQGTKETVELDNGLVRESLMVSIPAKDFKTICNSKRIIFEIGNTSYTSQYAQQAGLRKLAGKI